ncbi:MAG: sorbosone dehydrogenase [Omnitrophica WOR_2 bacterium RIFCSPHIGHO2_02_FULL_52_10]|nr:MAG: sorbosone dehydrogenase [Omnitrophica WOR_2 bacterium RIFCSPHIGHO2_02_FULL_52_10]
MILVFKFSLQIICVFYYLVAASLFACAQALPVDLIKLPQGFRIDIYAQGVDNARSLAVSPGGMVFVGSRTAGKVYALVDEDRDDHADKIHVIAEGLNMPNGVAFHGGALYVAEIHRVIKFENIEQNLAQPPQPVVVNADFADNEWHGWKFIRFGPDGKLYVPVGAPCNACEPPGPLFASIACMNPDGSGLEVFAEGVRNSVGFDWHPGTNELWFTDNGRDMLGDDLPPDELNHAPTAGMHFGFPYCHGGDIPDPQFGKKHGCLEFNPPAQKLGPHVAALGMRFYQGNMFPEEYRRQIIIAEHGSWNRSTKIGYRLMLVRLQDNQPISYDVFAEGWKQGEEMWGRPVDVQEMADGSLLVSDDYAGAVYRITYKGEYSATQN